MEIQQAMTKVTNYLLFYHVKEFTKTSCSQIKVSYGK